MYEKKTIKCSSLDNDHISFTLQSKPPATKRLYSSLWKMFEKYGQPLNYFLWFRMEASSFFIYRLVVFFFSRFLLLMALHFMKLQILLRHAIIKWSLTTLTHSNIVNLAIIKEFLFFRSAICCFYYRVKRRWKWNVI